MNRRNAIALFRLGRGYCKHVTGTGWVRTDRHRPWAVENGARVKVLEDLGLFNVTGCWVGSDDGGMMGQRSTAGHEALRQAFPHAVKPLRQTGAWFRFVNVERDILWQAEQAMKRASRHRRKAAA